MFESRILRCVAYSAPLESAELGVREGQERVDPDPLLDAGGLAEGGAR
jgi:hypothetical protein